MTFMRKYAFLYLPSLLLATTPALASEVRYQSHLAGIGDTAAVEDGDISGTIGEGRSMEALRIWNGVDGCSIQYEGHVDNNGWLGRVNQGDTAGTTGQSKKLQAVRIWLNGCANHHVRYRAHVENIGWQSWVNQGEDAGTTGRGLAIQAIQITVSTIGDAEVENLDSTRDGLAGQNGDTIFQAVLMTSQKGSLAEQKNQAAARQDGASSEVSAARAQLSQQQQSLDSTSAAALQAAQDLAATKANQAQRELEARQAADALAQAQTTLLQKLKDAADISARATALDQQAQQQTINLADLKAKEATLKAEAETSLAAAQGASSSVQNLVAQVGVLRGAGRTCSAFELSPTTLRTADHCVRDLSDAQIKMIVFTGSTGRTFKISGVAAADATHDSVDLQIAGMDAGFASVFGTPDPTGTVQLLSWDQKQDTISVSEDCKIMSIDQTSGSFHHNCTSAPGSSGGALIQDGQIVGFHLGILGADKLGVAIAGGLRSIDAALLQDLIPEYNCQSDCRAESYDGAPYPCPTFRNPGRICHQDVFNPAKFSACESARSADCGARALTQEFARARDNAHAEIDHLGHAVADVQGRVSSIGREMGDLRNAINDLNNAVDRLKSSAASLRDQIASVASQLAAKTLEYSGINQSIAAAQRAGSAAAAERDRAVAATGEAAKQLKDVTAAAEATAEQATQKAAAIAARLPEVAAAEGRNLTLSRAVAASHAVLAISKSGSVIPPVIAKQVSDIGGRLASLGKDAVKWTRKESAQIVQAFAHNIGPKIKKAIARAYTVTRDKAAVLDPSRIWTPTRDQYYVKRIFIVQECISRAEAVITDYKNHVDSLALVALANDTSSLDLSKIANATETIAADARALGAELVEIKANKCSKAGLDQPVKDTLDDATKWQEWLLKVRLNLVNNASR